MKSILLSIKVKHFNNIILGDKKAEIRKAFPENGVGVAIFVYVPLPVQEIKGFFISNKVNKLPIDKLWKVSGRDSALTKDDFFNYFYGKTFGYSIHFDFIRLLHCGVALRRMKYKFSKFYPPQSYQYLSEEMEHYILNS